jgi:hypothetical protein
MQFLAICTECKEMFLFTSDLLYVARSTMDGREGKPAILNRSVKPICFRCSDSIGSCIATRVCTIPKQDKQIEEDDPTLSAVGSFGDLR